MRWNSSSITHLNFHFLKMTSSYQLIKNTCMPTDCSFPHRQNKKSYSCYWYNCMSQFRVTIWACADKGHLYQILVKLSDLKTGWVLMYTPGAYWNVYMWRYYFPQILTKPIHATFTSLSIWVQLSTCPIDRPINVEKVYDIWGHLSNNW